MKWLTLNIHSWMEKETIKKMDILANFIISQDLDGISLQEVNQLIDAQNEVNPLHFISPENERPVIKQDNYALCLVKKLAELGATYYWSWTYSHIGYDIYEEGVAILSKVPIKPYAVLVSNVDDKKSVQRRMMLCAELTVSSKPILVTSNHYSWWDTDSRTGFQIEWKLSKQYLDKFSGVKLLFGDFNGPDNIKNETYDLVNETFIDTYKLSDKVIGHYTIPEEIDGWEGTKEQFRIDYAFISEKHRVRLHQVVLDGDIYPCVSDHYGIMVLIDM
ncbi:MULTISPECIES: endonuclease/exonuclease/phosphatase family protein [Vagococcus]|uniref:endonuclease/exonuclease/phosphatase family protein n=1 Tax=Vagococcus TaxID=2737 RepID=UPI000E47EBE4|nr:MULTISPECIES: endonuclease/exonuclease/phosphatase family protein [Vagococcus]RHH70044.1 hydrolase [Vagococcus sp. AM17-17]